MKLSQPLFVLALAVPALSTAGSAPTDFLAPDTKIVLGVHLSNLCNSAELREAMARNQAEGAQWLSSVLKVPSLAGFDPLRDIDEVWIASTGEGENPPAILVVSGRFDVARLGANAKRYHDVPLLGDESEGVGLIALLDGSTILAGDRALVQDAIDHRGESRADAALAERVAAMRDRYDVWGVGGRLEGLFPKSQNNGLNGIDRFQFGMTLSHGMELGAEIHAASPEAAAKLSSALQMVQMMYQAQQPNGTAAKLDLKSEDGTVTLALSVPEEELKKAIQAQAGRLPQVASAAQSKPPLRTKPARLPVAAAPATAPTPVPAEQSAAAPAAPMVAAQPPAPKPPVKVAAKQPSAGVQVLDQEGNTVILTLPGRK